MYDDLVMVCICTYICKHTHLRTYVCMQQIYVYVCMGVYYTYVCTYGYCVHSATYVHADVYSGHGKAVKEVCFNNDGTQFLSSSYDRHIKLWDTETGKCVSRFTNGKLPYCIKFNPDEVRVYV